MSKHKAKEGVQGDVSVPYPTPDQGFHSLQHMGAAALGRETISRNALMAHGWVSWGGLAGMAFPAEAVGDSGEGDAQIDLSQLKEEDRKTLEHFLAVKDNPQSVGAQDWKSMLKTVLSILMQFL